MKLFTVEDFAKEDSLWFNANFEKLPFKLYEKAYYTFGKTHELTFEVEYYEDGGDIMSRGYECSSLQEAVDVLNKYKKRLIIEELL